MKMLACPFCGGHDLTITGKIVMGKAVYCKSCGGVGPVVDWNATDDEAQEQWNRRPHKPVRGCGSKRRACCICEGIMSDYCPDCALPLCCQKECDQKHAETCAPIQRARMRTP